MKGFKVTGLATIALTFMVSICSAQAPENWFNKDYQEDGVRGLGTERVYKELIGSRKSQTVIVAVIDSGVDIEHEDLEGMIWVNPGEIAGNGKDDDNNGYVDDVHGWNYLGGSDGRNVNDETLEVTRVYAALKKKFDSVEDPSSLSKKDKAAFKRYKKAKDEVEKKREEAQARLTSFAATESMYLGALKTARELLGDKKLTQDLIDGIDPAGDQSKGIAKNLLMGALAEGKSLDELEEGLKEQLEGAKGYYKGQIDYMYNPDWNPRAEIIKDDYNNQTEIGYGNGDVEGPDAGHGTHVAGIICAVRGNGKGMDGVAKDVKIMSLRAVPNGDEYDKDIANAIRYAVDNGASIINMSFGKGWGWNKKVVDDAVKYAVKNDVLLVHAAGNSAQNNDTANNFPNDRYDKKGGLFKPRKAKTWMEIGALSWKKGEDAPATFSNYGKENVDVFSPGVDIYSTVPQSDYDSYSGTSMASPATAGVAALLRSYFPSLTAVQIKEIIMASIVPMSGSYKKPGADEKVPFSDLCVTGGVVSAYKAFQLAARTKGKKKVKKGA